MAAQDFFGLDIGSHSIKLVELTRRADHSALVAAGTVLTPPNVLDSEAPADLAKVADVIRKLRHDLKVAANHVVLALPESQVFSRVVEMPNLTEAEVASAIKWEAEQYVPIPLTEVNIDWQILTPAGGKDNKIEVLLVAAPTILVNKYLQVLKLADLTPISFETEIIAVARSLISNTIGSPTTLIISLGASTTDLTAVRAGRISFTRSIATGGLALTRAVAQELGFEMDQAEEYMKTYGLDSSQLEGKLTAAIKPVFDVVVNEIRRAIAYYIGKNPNDPIKRIVVSGGAAKLPGLVVYLADELGIEVQMANPWEGVELPEGLGSKLVDSGPTYAVAVGLAMKGL